MLKQLKQVAKHSAVYSIGNIASKVIGLILLPIYTNAQYFSQADFGIIGLLESSFQILSGILIFSMTSSLSRWYWDKAFADKQKDIYFTCYSFLVVMLAISFSALILNTEKISLLIFETTKYSSLIKLMSISVCFTVLNNLTLGLIKLRSKSILFVSIQILKLLLSLSISIYYIVYKSKGIEAIWEASIIAEASAFTLLIPFNIKHCKVSLEFTILIDMLRFGLPLMFASLSSVLLSTTDRYMINSMSGLEDTALYTLAGRIANILKLVITFSITTALAPIRVKKINEPNNQRFYSKILTYVAFIFMCAAIPISLFSQEIIELVIRNTAYIKSATIVPILVLSLFMVILNSNVQIGLFIKKKTKITGSLIFMTALINVGLNVLLIPVLDVYGAAISTLTSQIIFFGSIAWVSQRYYYIPYEWKKILLLVILFVIICSCNTLLTHLPLRIRIIVKGGTTLIFPFTLWACGFFEQIEIQSIKNIFNTWKNPKSIRDNINRLIK